MVARRKSGKFGWKTVTDTIVHYDRPVIRLALLDGHGHKDVLGVTGVHPFWVKHHGWTHAEDLLPGDEIFTSRGGWVKVGSASWTARVRTVYNLEVGGFHTYFVGDVGAWVANDDIESAPLKPTKRLSRSRREMRKFVDEVAADGKIKESIKYVEHNGMKYVVDGHHRRAAALLLGFPTVPAEEVSLPYAGYRTVADLFY